MAGTGNGPTPTSPLFTTDEQIAIHALGDFAVLCPEWQVLASSADGLFAANAPWVLTSNSVNFQQQGVAAQNVVLLTTPRANFPGFGHLFAVDSVQGNACTLRRVGQPLAVGQPPAPAAGLAGVTFSVPYFAPQIDETTYRLKQRYSIDEDVFYRSSDWIYQGAEDALRVFRDAVVFSILADLYEAQMRGQSENGEFRTKANRYKYRLEEALSQIQVRWGQFGCSAEPTGLGSCRLAR